MGKAVAIYKGVDSGGVCPCVTPPTKLEPPIGDVFANKIAVMANTDVLTSANGTTCTTTPAPCVSPRVVKSVSKVYINKLPVATIGDSLNEPTKITIPTGATSVFA